MLFNLQHDFDARGERFQEAIQAIRLASENRFPVGGSARFVGSGSSRATWMCCRSQPKGVCPSSLSVAAGKTSIG